MAHEIYEDAYLAPLSSNDPFTIIYLLLYLVCQSRIWREGYVSSISGEEVKSLRLIITTNYYYYKRLVLILRSAIAPPAITDATTAATTAANELK